MKNEEVGIGDHCWALSAGELLVVLKVQENAYDVCGAWECGMSATDLEIISVIQRPIGHAETTLYYVFDDD